MWPMQYKENRPRTSSEDLDYPITFKESLDPVHDTASENSIRYHNPRGGNKQQVKGSNGKSAVWTTRKSECFICRNQGHFACSFPVQFRQLCGKRGHGRRDCRSKNRVLLADIRKVNQGWWYEFL